MYFVLRTKLNQFAVHLKLKQHFKYEGEIKSFTNKQNLREFSTTKPAHQQMLKDLLYTGNTEKVYKLEPKTTK